MYNYRVLSLHIKKGFQKIIELRNPCLVNKNLPGVIRFYFICKKAIKIHSFALYASVTFMKEDKKRKGKIYVSDTINT
jgi:hypothetical protein